jgi:hypothetical protein
MKNRITPENIEELKKNEIFVFGSNLLGKHGAGAALLAYNNQWTKYGKYFGVEFKPRGELKGSFAIPTKGLHIETLPLEFILYFVTHFIEYATKFPTLTFYVTEIGCGLAGYTPEEIAPMFIKAVNLENVHLPQRFWNVLNNLK